MKTLFELPRELQGLVFQSLDSVPDVLNLSACCKNLRHEATSQRLTTIRLTPNDFVHISTRMTRNQAGPSKKLHSTSTWPWPPAHFPTLLARFPCIKLLYLEMDSRQPEFRVGRINDLIVALDAMQNGADPSKDLATIQAAFRSCTGSEKAVKGLLKGLVRITASGGLPHLTSLSLSLDSFMPHIHLANLSSLTCLTSLTINRAMPKVLGFIGYLTQLTRLDVGCVSLYSRENELVAAFAALGSLTKLNSFSMEGNEVSRLNEEEQTALCQSLACMGALTRLVLLDVKVRSECWMGLSLGMLHGIKSLTLPGPFLPGLGSFEYLGPPPPGSPEEASGLTVAGLTLPGLTHLATTYIEHFCGRNVDQGLKQFVFTPGLRSLDCSMFELDHSFRLAAQLGSTHLERLHITLPSLRTPLASLTHLTGLTAVKDFSLRDTQMGGGGSPDLRVSYVSSLLSAWTGLKRLELMGKTDMVGVGQSSFRPAPVLTLAAARKHLSRLRGLPLEHLALRLPHLPLEVLPPCLTSLELCGLAVLPPKYTATSGASAPAGPPGDAVAESAEDELVVRSPNMRLTRSAAAVLAKSQVMQSAAKGSPRSGHWRGGGVAVGSRRAASLSARLSALPASAAGAASATAQAHVDAAGPGGTASMSSVRTRTTPSQHPAVGPSRGMTGGGAKRDRGGCSLRVRSTVHLSAAEASPPLPQLKWLRLGMPEWSLAKSATELRMSFQSLVPLLKDRCEELELSRWALIKDQSSSLELDDYASVIAEKMPNLRRLQLVQVANWWDKIDCSQLQPLSSLRKLTHLGLQEPGRRWGVRVRNLVSLSTLASLSLLVTGIECAPGGASRLVLHGMSLEQRQAVLKWAQGLQDTQAGACLW